MIGLFRDYYCAVTSKKKKSRCSGTQKTSKVTKPKEETIKNSIEASVFKGLILSILSGLLIALCSVIVKYMKNVHPGQLALYRLIAIFALSCPDVVWSRENPFGPTDMRFYLVFRGILGGSTMFLNFFSFRYLPLGESASIIYSVPVFVTISARIFLNEPCGVFEIFAAIISVVGIMLTTRITETLFSGTSNLTKEYLWGVCSSVCSLLVYTITFIVLRKLKSVHHSVTLFNFGFFGILMSIVLTSTAGEFSLLHCGVQQYLVLVIGTVGHVGQMFLTMALQVEHAAIVSTLRAGSGIIFSFIFQIIIFRESVDIYSITGAILIMGCIATLSLRKWLMEQPDNSTYRKTFRCLTM